jgi:hypothetical protein
MFLASFRHYGKFVTDRGDLKLNSGCYFPYGCPNISEVQFQLYVPNLSFSQSHGDSINFYYKVRIFGAERCATQ